MRPSFVLFLEPTMTNSTRKRRLAVASHPAPTSATYTNSTSEGRVLFAQQPEPSRRRKSAYPDAHNTLGIPISASTTGTRIKRMRSSCTDGSLMRKSARRAGGESGGRRRRRLWKIPRSGVAALLLLGAGGGSGRWIVGADEIGEFGRPNSPDEEEVVDSHAQDEAIPKPKSALASDTNKDSPPVPPGVSNEGKTPVVAPVLPDRGKQGKENDKKGDAVIVDDSSKRNGDFLWWCQHVMGIKMPHVEIRTFAYPDYLAERAAWDAYHSELATARAIQSVLGDDNTSRAAGVVRGVTPPDTDAIPTVPVRGLAATQPISPGETIISIPLNAMISVQTTIDHDPVLSTVLGPAQRSEYGWDGANAPFYEVPLLIVAVLYHAHVLGDQSPLSKYIDSMRDAPVESMPFLLDHTQLRLRGFSDGVRTVIGEVQDDMRDMYATVVGSLVKDFPDVFGPPQSEQGDNFDDWAFSFDRFSWAFAVVNSRHWNVPVLDLDDAGEAVMRPVSLTLSSGSTASSSVMSAPAITPNDGQNSENAEGEGVDLPPHEGASQHLSSIGVDGIETPPAAQPTDAFVEQQVAGTGAVENSRESNERSESSEDVVKGLVSSEGPEGRGAVTNPRTHSFLAPLADLLNFGPPCTRGSYDALTHTFNVVATCSFEPGQEITFYYSGDCEDAIYANYGFVHPMIPACPTLQDTKKEVESWVAKSKELSTALVAAYEDMDTMEADINDLADKLEACGCQEMDVNAGSTDDYVPEQSQVTQQPTIANASGQDALPPQAPSRRTITDRAPHKELRGSAHAASKAKGITDDEGDASTDSHGGVRRLWRRISSNRDIRDIEDSL